MPPQNQSCAGCLYFGDTAIYDGVRRGRCMVHPPVVDPVPSHSTAEIVVGVWPMVRPEQWCALWRQDMP